MKGRKYYCVINLFFIICLGDSCRWCTLLSQSQKQTKHTHMQTCSLAEKYTLSIILAAGVLKSRKLTPWTFSPMVSGADCQNFYQLRRSPNKTPLRNIRFCYSTTIFRSFQNVLQIWNSQRYLLFLHWFRWEILVSFRRVYLQEHQGLWSQTPSIFEQGEMLKA